MKTIIYSFIGFLLFSCSSKTAEDIQWYKGEVIEQILEETDSTYNVQIGIMAHAFHLDNRDKNFKEQMELLKESMSDRKKLDIGVEKGSSRIVIVREQENTEK